VSSCPTRPVARTRQCGGLKQEKKVDRIPVWQRLTRMVGDVPLRTDGQGSRPRKSVWKRISPLQEGGMPEYISPSSVQGASVGGHEGLRCKRKRNRSKRGRGEKMTIDHPQQEAPVSVIGAASPDPSLLFGNNSEEFDSTLNSNCVLDYSDDLAREEIALRRALFVSVAGTRPMVLASEVVDEVARQFDIAVKNMSIQRTMPEDFLLLLPDEDAAAMVFNDGKALRGPRFTLLFKKWSRFAHASASSLSKLVDIEIRGIPEHARSRSTAEHILRNSCWITEVHQNSGSERDFASFWVRAWCLSPERLCRKLDLHILEPGDVIHEKRCLTYKIDISCRLVDLHPANSAAPPIPPEPFQESEEDQDQDEQEPHRRHCGDANAAGDPRRSLHLRLGPRPPLGRTHDMHGSREDPRPFSALGINCDMAGRPEELLPRVPGKRGDEGTAGGHERFEVLTPRAAKGTGHEEAVWSQEMQSMCCMGNMEDMAAEEQTISTSEAIGQRTVEKINNLSSFRPGGPRGWIAPWTPQLDISAGLLNSCGPSSPHKASCNIFYPLAESLGPNWTPLPQQIPLVGLLKGIIRSSPHQFLNVNGMLGQDRHFSPQQELSIGLLERPEPGSPRYGEVIPPISAPNIPPNLVEFPLPHSLSGIMFLRL
jgi:hypothetical protein